MSFKLSEDYLEKIKNLDTSSFLVRMLLTSFMDPKDLDRLKEMALKDQLQAGMVIKIINRRVQFDELISFSRQSKPRGVE